MMPRKHLEVLSEVPIEWPLRRIPVDEQPSAIQPLAMKSSDSPQQRNLQHGYS